ncbi:MAG: XRE family transcriptional regulator [Synergistaceae bacterium]|nr:XRE family transcriptional regulator [Synergistaceae bacterium]
MSIGSSIKETRKSKKLTLVRLAELTGISPPQLSKIENDKSASNVASIRKIADALDIPLSDLVMSQRVVHIQPVRANGGFLMKRGASSMSGVTERYLTIQRTAKMQPMVMDFPSGEDSGAELSHEGEEFFFVLEGKLRFLYGDVPYEMNRGDFIYYDCEISHKWENIGGEPASILVCNNPPVI